MHVSRVDALPNILFANYLPVVCSLKRESRKNIKVDSAIQFIYPVCILFIYLKLSSAMEGERELGENMRKAAGQ